MKISKLKPIFAKTQGIFLQKLKEFFQNSIFRKIRAPSIVASLINSSFVMQPFICTFSEWIWVWSAGSASVIFSTSQRVCASFRPRSPMNFQRKLKQSSKTLHVFKNSTVFFKNSTTFSWKLKEIWSKLNISETQKSYVAGKTARKQPCLTDLTN